MPAKSGTARKPRPIIGVHLDLKGMNFKPSYIPQYLADLAGQGVNLLLVEYEDCFPYVSTPESGDLSISPEPARVWSKATLKRFLAEAGKHRIEVVPLQQCLGHLEYLLPWRRFRGLAEDPAYPSTIRVDDPKAVALIAEMLRQVVAAHPGSRFVHIGMDEAHALKGAADRLGRSVLDLFLGHLRALLAVVEPMGKTPIIWTDMLEDHFRPGSFDEFKGRVVFATWAYSAVAETSPYARLSGGNRVSREWLDHPEDPAAPAIAGDTRFVEDHSSAIKRVLKPYRRGREYQSLFQIDLWTAEGMQVLPVGALRASADDCVLPHYNRLFSNVRGWSDAVRRTGQMGLIGSSWARGTTWCPPNYCIDLSWPIITVLARSMGARPKPFWPGIPAKTVDRIVRTLGRCREDWRLESVIVEEMKGLAPKLKAHRYEWDGLVLMTEVLRLRRQADYNLSEVDYFHANHRPVDTEWQRRISEQTVTLGEIERLRARVVKHFGRRYAGEAFQEWVRHLFDWHETRLRDSGKTCRRKLALARKVYNG